MHPHTMFRWAALGLMIGAFSAASVLAQPAATPAAGAPAGTPPAKSAKGAKAQERAAAKAAKKSHSCEVATSWLALQERNLQNEKAELAKLKPEQQEQGAKAFKRAEAHHANARGLLAKGECYQAITQLKHARHARIEALKHAKSALQVEPEPDLKG